MRVWVRVCLTFSSIDRADRLTDTGFADACVVFLSLASPHRLVPRQKLREGHRPVDAVDRLGEERGHAELSDLGTARPILDLAGGSPLQNSRGGAATNGSGRV